VNLKESFCFFFQKEALACFRGRGFAWAHSFAMTRFHFWIEISWPAKNMAANLMAG
jgi:hypothetical protein